VLHVTPEAAVGGPLGLVQSGDRIRLSVADRRLDLLVEDHVLAPRKAELRLEPAPARGYAKLYHDHVLAADRGCDFDFLTVTGP
jgi:dihydroxy-acid dehydratase